MGNLGAAMPKMAIGVDVGGTFTDIMMLGPGTVNLLKVPTTADPSIGAAEGLSRLGPSARRVSIISHATTLATNALLAGSGTAHTALITNEGFRDILEIGRQRRSELYDLSTRRPRPLVERKDRLTVRCRIDHEGNEVAPLDMDGARSVARRAAGRGFESVAIAFLNSYVNDVHEKAMRKVLLEEGFKGHVSLSSEVDREYREYERTSTTVVNAALSPLVSGYLSRLSSSLRRLGIKASVYVMGSDGGARTVKFASERPVSILESGPAAGVIASANLARKLRLGDVLTFDMGGTTAKAGAVEGGKPDVVTEFEAAGRTHSGRSIKGSGYAVRGEFIDLAEVSAGGGTIAWLDEAGKLRVGPESAGSNPGPACYGRGGARPTVTDANVVLGRISPKALLGGKMAIRHALAVESLRTLQSGAEEGVEGTATDILTLVNDSMAHAISIVSTERSRDPRKFTLLAFGGAGPLHACDLAENLGIHRIVVPAHAGLFSTYGLLAGEVAREFSAPVMKTNTGLRTEFQALERSVRRTMKSEGFEKFRLERYYEARYTGQSHEILLGYHGDSNVRRLFDARHRLIYGYSTSDALEVVNIRVKAVVRGRRLDAPKQEVESASEPEMRHAWIAGQWRKVDVYTRERTATGTHGRGPCIIEEYDSTAIVNPSWKWRAEAHGVMISC